MPLHGIEIEILRQACRSKIEALEIWLRRIIDEELSLQYGADYINFKNDKEVYLLKSDIRRSIKSRRNQTHIREIDAALFDDLINIIIKPDLFNGHFKKYFSACFPSNMQNESNYLAYLFERQKTIRNSLSHANPISIKNAEFTLWFTTELIESFKEYYQKNGKQMEYNVPQIIKITDSFGNVMHRRNFAAIEIFDFSNIPACFLRPGDKLSLTVEVDPSYIDASVLYRFGGTQQDYSPNNKVIHEVLMTDVNPRKVIHCQVKSTKKWHKTFNLDDQVSLYYKVLPPIES